MEILIASADSDNYLTNLATAAMLVEDAVFGLARHLSADQISNLVKISAQLDRLVTAMREAQLSSGALDQTTSS